jgi:biopolymer transport protein TolQ
MLYKWRQMKRLAAEDGRFHEAFRRSKSLKEAHAASARYEASSLSAVYRAGYTELARQGGGHAEASAPAAFRIYLRPLERSMRRAERLEHEKHRKRLGVLATVASSAPFIGLFGTVWGILNAFHKIGLEGSANVAAVAPGISEALIATAAGLAAAIPAVLGYNYFVALARGRASDMEAFVLECMTLIENAALREGNLGD